LAASLSHSIARWHRPSNPLVADYVLEYRDDVPLAVVEAKRTRVDAAAGIEQTKRYAQRLELPVAYATNGREIWEIELGGAIRQRPDFPSPEQLWERFCESEGVESQLEKELLLAPFDSSLERATPTRSTVCSRTTPARLWESRSRQQRPYARRTSED
jgi:type I restriction enzyme, R subunit